jgi:hypothetical protein
VGRRCRKWEEREEGGESVESTVRGREEWGVSCRKWEEGERGEEARLFLKVVFAGVVHNFGAR